PPRDVREDLARVSGVKEVEVEDLLRSVRVGAGLLIVGDAYPIECLDRGILEPTVITPHYSDAEDEYGVMPNPILHLVVRKGTKFRFYVAIGSEAINIADKLCKMLGWKTSPRGLIASILVASLQNGLGARTARGYGVFEVEQFVVRR
ncbi:MAG TPA: type III-B CRISPR module RAMP protein Cmr6, partial [Pyrodictium sp.]|nr:type III-B CRISPR module RAMP protein Cmr6 [Pyrodictium sp.]